MLERMYEVSEQASLQFIGYMTDDSRYDFAIIYTDSFYGKPLVVCMQSGRSATLCTDDLKRLDYLQKIYNLSGPAEAQELASFLEQRIQPLSLVEDY
jgi:hypothetical protein